MTERKFPQGDVVVCAKRTDVDSFGATSSFQALRKAKDPRALRMQKSHDAHTLALAEVLRELHAAHISYRFEDARAPTEIRDARLVVTVGGDGTLLLASHRVGPGVPVLGVNSAPETSVGFFCAARPGAKLTRALGLALRGKLKHVTLNRMEVARNDRVVSRRVLNDLLYCHTTPAATSRYTLHVHDAGKRKRTETQRSSGVWIGPAAGSTAAQRSAGGRVLPFSSKLLQYVVREPYTPLGQRLRLRLGMVRETGSVTIENEMYEAMVFLDGPRRQFPIAFGDRLTMRRSEEPLVVLGLSR